jgi:methyl-accepting chemotaxis protein
VHKSRSLAFKIGLNFCLLIFVLLVALFVVTTTKVSESLEQTMSTVNTQSAWSWSQIIGEMIEKLGWELKSIAFDADIRSGQKARFEPAIRHLEGNLSEEIVGAMFALPDGTNYTSSGARDNIADRDYFKAVMEGSGSDIVISEPVVSKSLGVPIIVFAMAVRDDSGRKVGMIGLQLKLSSLGGLVANIKVGDSGYAWLANGDGLVIAHPDASAVLSLNIKDADQSANYKGMSRFATAFLDNAPGSGSWIEPNGKEMRGFYVTVPHSKNWHLCLALPRAELMATSKAITNLFLVFMLIGLLVAIAVSAAIAKRILGPVKRAANGFRTLASGEADLRVRLTVERRDEIGQLSSDFNDFIAKLSLIVAQVKDAQLELESLGEGLGASVEQTGAAIAEMTGNIGVVREQAREEGESVNETASAVSQIANGIDGLGALIQEQAASITEASAAIEEMVGSIGSVSSSVDKMSGSFSDLAEAAGEGRNVEARVEEKILSIVERSKILTDANEMIASIASQTNLLAMNAAIEAAHAGEAGKGFAVVSDEIRRLAETSSDQSKTIGAALKDVMEQIESMAASSKEAVTAFDTVAERIESTEGLLSELKLAMDEESTGSRQILEALREMNDITSKVTVSSAEMATGNATILAEIERLKRSALAINTSLDSMNAESEELSAGVTSASKAAAMTRDTIKKVEAAVGRFTI